MSENDLPVGEEYWENDRMDIIRDSSIVWTKKRFEVVPGVWTPIAGGGRILRMFEKGEEIPEGSTLDKTAWDHEHCMLCWQTISEHPSDQQEGYTDGKLWLCVDCYNKHIGGTSEK
jgi:hypothetical protein